MLGNLAGCRNKIAHDVNYTLTYALSNGQKIQNLLTEFSRIIEGECTESELNNFNFDDRYLSMQQQFIDELAMCLNDLEYFASAM